MICILAKHIYKEHKLTYIDITLIIIKLFL